MDTSSKSTLKTWAQDDQPREKLLSKGKESLSNSELLAILLGSGSKNETAVELAKRILEQCENNLIELSKLSINDLKKFKGVGVVKAKLFLKKLLNLIRLILYLLTIILQVY